MHIAVLGPASPPDLSDLLGTDQVPQGLGGTPVNQLCRGLVERGHNVDLITCVPHISDPVIIRGERLTLRAVPWRQRPRERALDFFRSERRHLRAQIAASDADLLHAHWTYEYGMAAGSSGRPAIVTIHDAPLSILRHHRDAYRLIRALMATRVRLMRPQLTAVSPYVARQWQRQLVDRSKITVVPNIADERPLAAPPQPPVIACIASSDPLKNVRSAVRAFSRVSASRPGVRLVVVGPGLDSNSQFASWVKEQGMDTSVDFVGPVPPSEVASHLQAATILIHPSLEEAQSMILNEAIASGIPVIAGSRSGGVPWSLGDGTAGILVDVRSPDAIAEAVIRLLDDAELRKTLSARGRELAGTRFSADAVVDAYLEEYANALRRGRFRDRSA